jgi:phage I-like protein
MNSNTHLLNRMDAVPNFRWMHVCPIGEHAWTSADGSETIMQIIDREACEAMAKSYPLSIPNSRIDIDHESMDADKRTAAVGWGRKAEARDDGLWVEVEWNPDGHELIANKVYRFNSPVFPRDGLVDLGNGRKRVTKLGVIALTNDPNLRGQKPLTNRRSESASNTNTTKSTMDLKAILLSLLGLPADASDDDITAAVSAAKAAKTDKAAMNSRITELETQLVNRDLEDHGITDVEQRKLLTPMLANSATRPAALALLGKSKAPAQQQPLHNRSNPNTPKVDALKGDGGDPEKEAEAEKDKADWIGNRARELKAANSNRTHRDCFSQAEADFRNRA